MRTLTALRLSTFWQDVRYALRQLRRSPGFALTVLLTLGLGIGASTALYTLVRSTLLAPLPYPEQELLAGVGFAEPGQPAGNEQTGETAEFIARHSRSFASTGVADDGVLTQNLSLGNGEPRSVQSLRVSAAFLPTLGAVPLLGRTFTAEEDKAGAAHVAVISEALWRGALASDSNVIGRLIHLNSEAYTVIGVMPRALATAASPDVWQPLHLSPQDPGYYGDNFQMIARLRPGVSLPQASAEMQTLNADLYRTFPGYAKWTKPGTPRLALTLAPLQQVVTGHARVSLLTLGLAVGAVLLMVCLNLGGLLLARSAVRQGELGVRMALGAGRGDLLRLLIVENLLLALGGSGLGLLLALVLVPALSNNPTLNMVALQSARTDGRTVVFSFALGLVTVALFGLLPAFLALRRSSLPSVTPRTATGGREQQRLGKGLVVMQVAVTTMLLSVGALLMGTLLKMRSLPVGVDVPGLYTAQVSLRGATFQTADATTQFVDGVLSRLRAGGIPVEAAAVNGLPLDRGLNASGGPTAYPAMSRNMEGRFITPGYFHVSGQRLLAGANLSSSVTRASAPVALINHRAAQLWFGERPAVGEFVTFGGGVPRQIIGVVADARGRGLADAVRPSVYLPLAQMSDDTVKTINGWFPTTFLLRVPQGAEGDSQAMGAMLLERVSQAIRETNREVPLGEFAPMQQFVDRSVEAPRFFTAAVLAFAAVAVLLSALGTFGLLSYQVTMRTREFGVRMALGSDRNGVLRLVLGRGMLLATIGLTMGALGSLVLRQVIRATLAGALDLNPVSLAGVLASPTITLTMAALTILLTVLFAAALPARRASAIEPMLALRTE